MRGVILSAFEERAIFWSYLLNFGVAVIGYHTAAIAFAFLSAPVSSF